MGYSNNVVMTCDDSIFVTDDSWLILVIIPFQPLSIFKENRSE